MKDVPSAREEICYFKKIYKSKKITPILLWIGVFLITILVGIKLYYSSFYSGESIREERTVKAAQSTASTVPSDVQLSTISEYDEVESIHRQSNLFTIIPSRVDLDVITYTVSSGDSIFGIAKYFNITPETVLWANYDQLNDNPDLISTGMELKIPPVDGVYYQLGDGDTLENIAGQFGVTSQSIMSYSGNELDLTNPVLTPGEWIMLPGGHREFRQWLIPVIPRGQAGVLKSVYGAGACEGNYDGAYGTGSFVWPAGNHVLSGNDYWSGHLGIDIGAGDGAGIFAADSGVVVFAGWATGGYGNMVMIDHGNGYQTLYAHLSKDSVSCGQSVSQGNTIGYAGSTGNSTGAHLHFEVRYQGGFISPWYILPAP